MAYAERNCTTNKIEVTSTWMQRDMIKAIPGSSWNGERRIWTTRLSWAACVQLRAAFPDLIIGPQLRAWALNERSTRVDVANSMRELLEPNAAYSGDERLHAFQRAGTQFLWWAGSAILGDEMGLGKTVQVLETMRRLGEDAALPALVVAPKGLVFNWRREAWTWFPDAVPYVVQGTAAQRRKILVNARADARALVIINYEAMRLHSRTAGFGSINLKKCSGCDKYGTDKPSACELHPRELNEIPFKTVIVDEAHRMKDPNSKQTRAIWAVGRQATVTRRIAMTGTLIANHAGDMWSVLHLVAPDEFPTKSKFVDRYCQAMFNQWGGLDIGGLNPATKDEFFKIINPRYRRTPKALVLPDLPRKIYMPRYVQMTPTQYKAYWDLEERGATRLPDGTVLVPTKSITVYGRQMQLASAMLESDGTETGVRMCDPSPKLDVLEEILDDMDGKPLVICAESRQLIDLAAQRLVKRGVEHALIVGGVPQWDRDVQLARFQSGELNVLLFTMQAGGVGLTMTAADTICVLQWSGSMILNAQSIDRVHRIGSEIHDSIKVISIVAEGTLEEGRVTRIQEKLDRLDEINRDRERYKAQGLDVDVMISGILNENLEEEEDDVLMA